MQQKYIISLYTCNPFCGLILLRKKIIVALTGFENSWVTVWIIYFRPTQPKSRRSLPSSQRPLFSWTLSPGMTKHQWTSWRSVSRPSRWTVSSGEQTSLFQSAMASTSSKWVLHIINFSCIEARLNVRKLCSCVLLTLKKCLYIQNDQSYLVVRKSRNEPH